VSKKIVNQGVTVILFSNLGEIAHWSILHRVMFSVNEEIESDETVIWAGRPKKAVYVLPGFGGIPFALFFLLIAYLIYKYSPQTLFLTVFVSAWL
jgi:hypothetical protein